MFRHEVGRKYYGISDIGTTLRMIRHFLQHQKSVNPQYTTMPNPANPQK